MNGAARTDGSYEFPFIEEELHSADARSLPPVPIRLTICVLVYIYVFFVLFQLLALELLVIISF